MFRKTLLAASIAALINTAAHASPLDGAAAYQAHVWNAAATDLQFMQQGIWASGGSTFSTIGDQIRYKLTFTYLPAPISTGQTFTIDVVSATSGGRTLSGFPSTLTCSLDYDNSPIQQFVGCSGIYTITADDIGKSIQPVIRYKTSASAIVEAASPARNSVSYVAQPFITPENNAITLECGVNNFFTISSSSRLTFSDSTDELALENEGYSIMQTSDSLILSGVGKNMQFERYFNLQNEEGISKQYFLRTWLPASSHEGGVVSPVPVVSLNVKAGETIDISSALLSANAGRMNEYPQVIPGFFQTTFETSMGNLDGVTSGSYADLGHINANGVAGEGAGRRYSFKAADAAKNGTVEFWYHIKQRLDGPSNYNCNPWTYSANGLVRVVVDGVGPETPVDPSAPTAGAKFMFRYPTPPMLNVRT